MELNYNYTAMKDYSNEEAYLRAKKRVEDLKGFYWNVFSYIIIIPILAYVNYITYWEVKWFLFSMAGWGLGILFHAFAVFGKDRFFNREWEERKIREYMEKDSFNKFE